MNNVYTPVCMKAAPQYTSIKPVKCVLKVGTRADAENGYFCNSNVYVGRPSDGTSVETGLGEQVVKQLTATLQGKHYLIFCNNFVPPALLQGLYMCGTTRTTRRGYPTILKGITVECGKQMFC